MENNQQDVPKPHIFFCSVEKFEVAVKIAFIFGLIFSVFNILLFCIYAKFIAFLLFMCSVLIYLPLLRVIQKAQYLGRNEDGTIDQRSFRPCYLNFSLFIMGLTIALFAFQTGYLIYELRRTPCEARSQCPEWSSRCQTNFAQILTFDLDKPRPRCYKSGYSYPNEGVIERVFEEPNKLRSLKCKILEMATNRTNVFKTMTNETLLEAQLKPYFDVEDDENHTFESIEDMEANCELKRGRWQTRVLCPEKVEKLKRAFMDIYWAQVKKQRWNSNSSFWHKNGQITEDEIDAIFVVPYNCHSLNMALNISSTFLISHLVIFAIFFRSLPYFAWLDYATQCPIKCYNDKIRVKLCDELCEHCPLRMM